MATEYMVLRLDLTTNGSLVISCKICDKSVSFLVGTAPLPPLLLIFQFMELLCLYANLLVLLPSGSTPLGAIRSAPPGLAARPEKSA